MAGEQLDTIFAAMDCTTPLAASRWATLRFLDVRNIGIPAIQAAAYLPSLETVRLEEVQWADRILNWIETSQPPIRRLTFKLSQLGRLSRGSWARHGLVEAVVQLLRSLAKPLLDFRFVVCVDESALPEGFGDSDWYSMLEPHREALEVLVWDVRSYSVRHPLSIAPEGFAWLLLLLPKLKHVGMQFSTDPRASHLPGSNFVPGWMQARVRYPTHFKQANSR